MNSRAYLDWNATAPVRAEARAAMDSALDHFGNPSSIHAEGRRAKDILEEAREEVAAFMGCARDEVVFTSGGFEANNIAVISHAASAASRSFASAKIEHGSVMGRLEALVSEGWDAHWLPVTIEGIIDHADLPQGTGFACLQAMNQETGALQPVKKFGEKCLELGIPWHCDAVQLWGRGIFSVKDLTCATASLTGHKIGAPKGTGALFARKGFEVKPLMLSGPQEKSRRPGTENVAGAAALAAACRAAAFSAAASPGKWWPLRERLIGGIRALYPMARFNGPEDEALQVMNTLSVCFPGLEGPLLVQALDLEGVAVSSGSACASGASKPSPVLTAMGIPEAEARGAMRISMGWETGAEEVEIFLAALKTVLSRLPEAKLP